MHQHAVPTIRRREAFGFAARHGAFEQRANFFITRSHVALHFFPIRLRQFRAAQRHLQCLHPHTRIGLHRDHRHAEPFSEFFHRDGDAASGGFVGFVQHDNRRQA